MARHAWSVLCRKDVIDQSSKQVSLLDIVEKITLAKEEIEEAMAVAEAEMETAPKGFRFPFLCRVVSFWARSDFSTPETFDMRVRLLDSRGRELLGHTQSLSLEKHPRARASVRLSDLIFVGEGHYGLVVEKRDAGKDGFTRQTMIPLEIALLPKEEMASLLS